MKGYISITELSRMRHITTETLRHYDRINLFKPDYVDPVTKYRYYRLANMEVIDTILDLRDIGLSLAEIKDFMEHRNVELSYELLRQREKALAKEVREKERILKQIRQKAEYIHQIWENTSDILELSNWQVLHLTEQIYVVSGIFRDEMEDYLYDITKLRQNLLEEESSFFATNYAGSIIQKESITANDGKRFIRMASLPANKCVDDLKTGNFFTMPEGDYLCGTGTGYFQVGNGVEQSILTWLDHNQYEIAGDVVEYGLIDMALTTLKEEMIFKFYLPVKKIKK